MFSIHEDRYVSTVLRVSPKFVQTGHLIVLLSLCRKVLDIYLCFVKLLSDEEFEAGITVVPFL